MTHFSSKSKTLKRINTKRWSSRDDACLSYNESWNEIINALSEIEKENSETPETRSEAAGLRHNFEYLETNFMAILWGFLQNRLNAVSKKLQSIEIDVVIVLELYDSLIELIRSQRNEFDNYEEKALIRSTIKQYKTSISRKKKRKKFNTMKIELVTLILMKRITLE